MDFFSLIGLVLFGLFPATTAMFTVVRKWIRNQSDLPILHTFLSTYKNEFVKSNLMGLIVSMIGLLLYINFNIIAANPSTFNNLLFIALVVLLILFTLTLLYVFPIMVHFDVKLSKAFKHAFALMIIHPLVTIAKVLILLALTQIFLKIPGIIPFFSGSIVAFLLMWVSHIVLNKHS